MTKGTKVILIIGLACIVASLVIFGFALWLGGASFEEGMDTEIFGVDVYVGKDGIYTGGAYTEEVTVGEYIADETITALDVNWTSGDVYFVVGGDVLTATETYSGELSENQQMVCSVSNGTLKIEYNYGKNAIVSINETVGGKVLTVTIPEHVISDLESILVSTTSAEVTISDMSAGAININTTSGDVFVTNISAGMFAIDTNSGCAELTNVAAGAFIHKSTSGDLTAIECSFGSVECDTTSGSAYMTLNNVPSELDAEATSGSFEIYLPENAEFTLEVKHTSGNLELDFPSVMREDEYVVGSGRNEFDIETTSGDIFIRVK